MPAKTQPAVAFYRKNGDGRYAKPLEAHRKAIREFATAAGYNIAAEFADKLVPGRFGKGFTSLLKYVETTGAPTVIVAASSEFATDPIDRAVAYAVLLKYRIRLVAADDPAAFDSNFGPELIERIIALCDRFEGLLARACSDAAEERRQATPGPKHRRRYADMLPEAVELAKNLYGQSQRGSTPMSYRQISGRLTDAGYLNKAGRAFHAEEIRRMIKGPMPRGGGA